MNGTFTTLYRQLGRVTLGMLVTTLALYGAAIVMALLGVRRVAEGLSAGAAVVAFLFVALFGLFLMASLVAAVIRWLDRRSQNPAQRS